MTHWKVGSGEMPGEDLVVKTEQGRVRGYRVTSRSGREYFAFSGIPYAKPPVGNLIFQPPEPVEPWSGIRDALEDGPWCIQYNIFQVNPTVVGVLDCLYLSIYTHDLNGRAPVLVRLHLGGFATGNGPRTGGSQYYMDEDIVSVQVNYRVGIYGFLSLEDEDLPGNQGMKDQVMALKWIQENIASFGGDPTNVTLVGDSAGGASAYHHIVSPMSQGLFSKAIAQSGSSYNNWAVAAPGEGRCNAMKLLKALNYTYTNSKAAVDYLRGLDPKQVVSALEKLKEWQVDPLGNIKPVFEKDGPDAFLTWPPSGWQHKPVPLLTGINAGEGLLRTEYFLIHKMDWKWFSEHFEEVAPMSILYQYSASEPSEVTEALREYYLPNWNITINDWVNVTQMYGDGMFSMGVLEGANKHTGDVYFYYFDYLGEFSYKGHRDTRNPKLIFAAGHNDDAIYLYKPVLLPAMSNLKGQDLEVSKKMIKIWTDFAKYGKPTPDGGDLQWDTWTSNNHRYLHISKDGFRMKRGLAEDRYKLWQNVKYRDVFEG